MLGKLLKYDLKWIYKIVVVFYILAFVFSIIGRIFSEIENSVVFSVISKIAFGFAISMMISSLINCLMRLWARVIKNMYKDESYLTHTIPVEKKTIFTSKVITAIITIFTTTIVSLICLFICYYSKTNIEMLKSMLELAASTYNITVVNLLLLIALVLFTEIMFVVLIGYLGIILGHKLNKNKIANSIIFGFTIYMVFQGITLGLIYIFGLINPEIMNLINTKSTIDVNAIKIIMYAAIAMYVGYSLIIYIVSQKQLARGVNVD